MKNPMITLQKVARAVSSQHNVEVIFEGTQAYTDGRKIVLPSLSSSTEPELLQDIQGYLDHELAHVLYTDFLAVKTCRNKLHHYLSNHCEDVRIERIIQETFPGTRLHLVPLNQKWDKVTSDKWDQVTLFNRVCLGVRAIMEGKEPRLDPDTKPLFTKRVVALSKSLRKARNTAEVIATCGKILRELDQEQQKEEQGQGEQSQDQEQKEQGQEQEQHEQGGGQDQQQQEQGRSDQDQEHGNEESEGGEGGEEQGDQDQGEGKDQEHGEQQGSQGGVGDQEQQLGEEAEDGDNRSYTGRLVSEAFQEAEHDDEKPEDIHTFIEREIEGSVQEMEEERAKKSFSEQKHIPYTTAHDDEHDYSKHVVASYTALKQAVSTNARRLAQELDRILLVREERRTILERESGRVNRKALPKLILEKNYRTPFKNTVREDVRDVSVQLVVDLSGSMNGQKVWVAQRVAATFAEALNSLQIDCEVVGFNTRSKYFDAPSDLSLFNRFGDTLQHYIFKSFGSINLTPIALMSADGANCDGESIRYFAERIYKQKNRRKIMLVLSDGKPNSDGIGEILNADLRRAVQEITANGVEVVGIGICTSEVAEFYPDHLVVNDVEDLLTTCAGKLKSLLKQA